MQSNSSIGSIKALIEAQQGFPAQHQRLNVGGKQLMDDERTLFECDVTDGTTLCLGLGLNTFHLRHLSWLSESLVLSLLTLAACSRFVLDDAVGPARFRGAMQLFVKTLTGQTMKPGSSCFSMCH